MTADVRQHREIVPDAGTSHGDPGCSGRGRKTARGLPAFARACRGSECLRGDPCRDSCAIALCSAIVDDAIERRMHLSDNRSRDRETAIHEAGHAIMAYVLAHDIAEMRISEPDDPKTEGVSVIRMDVHDVESAEKFIAMLFGGIVAISIDTGVVPSDIDHFKGDFRRIEEIRRAYPISDERYNELLAWVTGIIAGFHESGTIERLVQELIRYRRLSSRYIYDILGQ